VEGRLILLGMEPLEQVPVGQFSHLRVFDGAADELQDRVGCCLGHHAGLFGGKLSFTYIVP
jgi:hypothetical protein